jgi:hypothetical protein
MAHTFLERAKTEVVFNRYRNSYPLKGVWLEGSTSGVESTSAEGERHAAKAAGAKGEQRVAARRKSHTTSGQ